MSKDESKRRKRDKTEERIGQLTGWLLDCIARCNEECGGSCGELIAFVMANAAISFIRDAAGLEDARSAVDGLRDILEGGIGSDGVESETRH
jgi:hypothetical protein